MKILVILTHPKPGSLNHAIADTVCRSLTELGHTPIFHDLYAEKFDPVLTDVEMNMTSAELPEPIQSFTKKLLEVDGYVFVHPNWWGGPPAMLRGWLDRVVRSGIAYNFTENGLVQKLGDKIVQIFTTSNTPREVELNVYKDPVEWFWKVIVFGLCGCKSFERRNFESVIMSTTEERQAWLREVEELTRLRWTQ